MRLHIVYGLLYYFINMDEVMDLTKARNLGIVIGVILEAKIAQRETMSTTVLSYLHVMGIAHSTLGRCRHHLELR